MNSPPAVHNPVLTQLQELKQLWMLLPDMLTTQTPLAERHPMPLNQRPPLRFAVIDAQNLVLDAMNQAVDHLTESTPGKKRRTRTEDFDQIQDSLTNQVTQLNGEPTWPALEAQLLQLLQPAIDDARIIVDGVDRPATCPQCGNQVHVEDETLICNKCGPFWIARRITLRDASTEFGVNLPALRKATHRHQIRPAGGEDNTTYDYDAIATIAAGITSHKRST
jgi:predicted RNA-binding Zn-ribbon protein involved in translation (DUF1610 family)